MKVLFNTCFSAFFQKGGGEVQLIKSKEALEKIGHEVILYNHWAPQTDFDVFHQFSIEPGVEQVVRKYKELGKKIAVSTIMWNLPPKDHHEFFRIKSILEMADILFTNSNIESNRLSDWFLVDIDKFHKTRNSVSENYFIKGTPEVFRKKTGIQGDFVLCVANIDQRKNTHNLIQACKGLELPLVTIGHIKDISYFSLFEKTYSKYIHLGPIEEEAFLKSAYSACSVFALPSLCETPGIAALEAGSQGAKIVITIEGSAQEYFGSMAYYVDPSSLDSIKDGIDQAMKTQRTDIIEQHVRQNYTWDITANEITEGYRKIL